VVGAGILGVRIARELTGPGADGAPTNSGVVLVTRRPARREQLADSFGSSARILLAESGSVDLPDDVGVVVIARESVAHEELVRSQLAAGRHVVSTADDPDVVGTLLGLHGEAVAAGSTVLAGAAMSPGLSCLLARHAAVELDSVDEIHVARHGAAGPACARQRLRALRRSGVDWRDGDWVRRPGFSGRELCWFPDPVGALDCYRGALAEPLLLAPVFSSVRRVTARVSARRRDRTLAPFPVLFPPPAEGGLGAIRVELRGDRGGERHSVILGALDRPAVAAAGVAAVAALRLAHDAPGPGVGGLAGLPDTLAFLNELSRRGVRAARFEGSGPEVSPSDETADLAQGVQVPQLSADTEHSE
jgi:hypothetical protein